jgi:excisionase family DNA binding protein
VSVSPKNALGSLDHPSQTLTDRLWLSVPEAGRLLGLGRSAAYAAADRGDIPVRRLGRRLLVPVPALCAWLGADVTVTVQDLDETMSEDV